MHLLRRLRGGLSGAGIRREGRAALPHVAAITDTCLARRNVACQSCGESCPEQAIRFRPVIGGPFLPEIDEAKCTGCGACLGGCPVSAIAVRAPEAEVAHV